MSGVRLPIVGTAWISWRDGVRALVSMPGVAVIALVASLFVAVAEAMLARRGKSTEATIGIEFLSFALGVLKAFLLAPLAIAVHRHVLLGEVTTRYALEPGNERLRNFVLYGVLVQLMLTVPSLLTSLASLSTTLILTGAAIFLTTRLLVLFPAIAVDGPGAHLMGAMQNSRGHFFQTFFTVILVALAALVVPGLPVVFLTLAKQFDSDGAQLALSVMSAPLDVAMLAAYAALASYLYLAWGRFRPTA